MKEREALEPVTWSAPWGARRQRLAFAFISRRQQGWSSLHHSDGRDSPQDTSLPLKQRACAPPFATRSSALCRVLPCEHRGIPHRACCCSLLSQPLALL